MLEFRIRLPGTVTPVSLFETVPLKAKDLLNKAAQSFQLQDPNDRTVVIAPTPKSLGRGISNNDNVEVNSDEVIIISTVAKYIGMCETTQTTTSYKEEFR